MYKNTIVSATSFLTLMSPYVFSSHSGRERARLSLSLLTMNGKKSSPSSHPLTEAKNAAYPSLYSHMLNPTKESGLIQVAQNVAVVENAENLRPPR